MSRSMYRVESKTELLFGVHAEECAFIDNLLSHTESVSYYIDSVEDLRETVKEIDKDELIAQKEILRSLFKALREHGSLDLEIF